MDPLEQFIKQGYEVFSSYERPKQCIDHRNDPEYREYEESLEGIDRGCLEMKHIGHICWGPLSALGSEAFAHFLPRLIDYAVRGGNDEADEPFMFLFTLVSGIESGEERYELLGYEQREFLFRTFLLLKALYYDQFKKHYYDEDLDKVIEYWET